MIILPSGYLYFPLLLFPLLTNVIASVSGPIFPIYIVNVIMTLPNTESSGVTSLVLPTVARADVASKNKSKNGLSPSTITN